MTVHQCSECGYVVDRDVAAAMVVRHRGLAAVGHTGLVCFLLAKRARLWRDG